MFIESDDMFAADFDVSCLYVEFMLTLFVLKGCSDLCLISLSLSYQSARLRAAGIGKDFKENPNLRDNWTDSEGYYRKS